MFLALHLQQAVARVSDGVRHPANVSSLVAAYDDVAGGVDHQTRGLGDGLCIDGGHGGARLEARDGTASFLRAHARTHARTHTHTHTHTHTQSWLLDAYQTDVARRVSATCRVCILVDDGSLSLELLAFVGQHRRILLRHPEPSTNTRQQPSVSLRNREGAGERWLT